MKLEREKEREGDRDREKERKRGGERERWRERNTGIITTPLIHSQIYLHYDLNLIDYKYNNQFLAPLFKNEWNNPYF